MKSMFRCLLTILSFAAVSHFCTSMIMAQAGAIAPAGVLIDADGVLRMQMNPTQPES